MRLEKEMVPLRLYDNTVRKEVVFISEFEAVKNFLRERDISFNFLFRGSKYAAYRLKPDGFRVIRLDKDYFVVSSNFLS